MDIYLYNVCGVYKTCVKLNTSTTDSIFPALSTMKITVLLLIGSTIVSSQYVECTGGYCQCDTVYSDGCEFNCYEQCPQCQACNICNGILGILIPWQNETTVLNETIYLNITKTIWNDIDAIEELCRDRPSYPCYIEQQLCDFACNRHGDSYDISDCLSGCSECSDSQLCVHLNQYMTNLQWAISTLNPDNETKQIESYINNTRSACYTIINSSGTIISCNFAILIILSIIMIVLT